MWEATVVRAILDIKETDLVAQVNIVKIILDLSQVLLFLDYTVESGLFVNQGGQKKWQIWHYDYNTPRFAEG